MTLRRKIKNIIGKAIELIERYEYRNLSLDEDDINKKIIGTIPLENVEVLSDKGYVNATHIHKTQPYTVYEITLENGNRLECADTHIVFDSTGNEIFIKDLRPGYFICTKTGLSKVKSIYKCPFKVSMYDMTIDSPDHRYYTNDILSHNTTTISAFLAWMIVFHIDRNILIIANKEKTAIEIVDKITNIFKGLPFFLKPGCESFGKTGLKLENGSQIISSATTNSASIGFTIHCVLLDEFAHIADNIVSNFWRSVYPTLSSSEISQCIITSTPNGTTNKFYEIWSKSVEGKNSFVNIRTDYWEVPGHDDAWAAAQKADFGEEEFAQEFELQFNVNSKMLLKAADMTFMAKTKTTYVKKELYGISNRTIQEDENIKWHPDFDPNSISENDKFVFLVDLAEGTANKDSLKNKKRTPDSNTISIFKVVVNSIANMRRYSDKSCSTADAFRFIQVGKYECNSEDEIYCGNVAAGLAYDLFKEHERENVKVMVEMNFNGKSFIQTMQKHPDYSDSTILRTYHTKPVPGEKQRRRLGFKTTTTKENYCLKGAKLINMKRIIITDDSTFTQLQSFGYIKGKLGGIACHDDLSYPALNHIPRMLDEETFIEWLDDVLFNYEDEVRKYQINMLIEKWDMDNPETSDSTFSAMYGTEEQSYGLENAAFGFGKNPYSANVPGTPYSEPPGATYSSLVRRR